MTKKSYPERCRPFKSKTAKTLETVYVMYFVYIYFIWLFILDVQISLLKIVQFRDVQIKLLCESAVEM